MKRKKNPAKKDGPSGPEKLHNPVQTEEDRSREGGDEALTDFSPTDSRLDEKVIVNEQRANKTVNAPSQTAAYPSESSSYDDEIIDDK